ncbi:hypothetical protein EAG_04440, partial [Camponotus floridanus]
YKDKIKNIKDKISNAKYVCTTADIWSSHSRRFIGVTAHWIDEQSFKRMSYAIACKRFSGSHTHDRIAIILNEIHSKYEITNEKLVATVTDNGSNFVKAFKKFGVHLDDSLFHEVNDNIDVVDYIENEEQDGNEHQSLETISFEGIISPLLPPHQRCASHTLHLVATTDILNGINSHENMKLLYNDVIKKCTSLWNLTRSPKKYEIIVETLGEALKRPVATRWNSLFDCFKQLLKFLEEYVKCTEPIAEALDILQGEVDVSYGYLLPTIISAKNKLQKIIDADLIYCTALVNLLITSLEKRFSNLLKIVEEGKQAAVAAATHPKFKIRWLKCLNETARDNAMAAIKRSTACEIEFQRFCQEQKNDISILHAYPIIKPAFMKFNTLLPSSAPVERLFSFATMFDTAKFNRLTDENFEKRVLSKANSIF